MGFRQFRPQILSLQEQANAVRTSKALGIGQKQGQGGQGPRRQHVEGFWRQGLDAGILDPDLQAHAFGGGAEEGTFLSDGLVDRDGDLRAHRS